MLMTPQSGMPLPGGEKRRGLDCEECGEPIPDLRHTRSRDRKRYEADPEFQRERSRRYYRENREVVLAQAAQRRQSS